MYYANAAWAAKDSGMGGKATHGRRGSRQGVA